MYYVLYGAVIWHPWRFMKPYCTYKFGGKKNIMACRTLVSMLIKRHINGTHCSMVQQYWTHCDAIETPTHDSAMSMRSTLTGHIVIYY